MMNKHKVVLFITLALTLLVSAVHLDSVVLAQSLPVRKVTWRYMKTNTIAPGRAWFDREGYHIRGRVDVGRISGDVQGIARVEYNADYPYNNVDGKPFLPRNGAAFGRIVIYPYLSTTSDLRYDWSGTWSYGIRDGKVISGSLVATNRQLTERMRVTEVYQNTLGYLMHHGIIERLICEGMPCR
jgi:hypothetical protein